MQKKHLMLLCCAAATWGACASQPAEIEETPPPAATAGEEVSEPMAAPPPAPPEPEVATPAAQPAEPPAPEPPSAGAVIVHKVKDYDKWKAAFDAHEGARIQAGIVGHGLSMDADKKNTVVVYLGTDDLEALQAFLDSKDLKQAMKEAGVQGKPQITLMSHATSKPASAQVSIAAMISHDVEDYDAWKAAFEAHADARAAAGVIGESVSQDPEDPNRVYVYLQGTDADKLRAFAKDPELKKAMKEAGVKGKPTFSFTTPIEMKMYPPAAEGEAQAPAESPAPRPAPPAP